MFKKFNRIGVAKVEVTRENFSTPYREFDNHLTPVRIRRIA
jgi:hypothetical protein